MAREFEHKGWRVVIDKGVVAIDNHSACRKAGEAPSPEPERVVVPDDLIDFISDKLPPRRMREEGRV